MSSGEELFLGVDIGGTKVAAGLVNERGEILHKTRQAMHTTGTAAEALAGVQHAIDDALSLHPSKVRAIGLVSPGAIDPVTGTVLNATNLPCWRNFPLAESIRRIYGLPTILHNDANAAGLAEALWGAGVGYSDVFCATIGTGIGTASVVNGVIHLGRSGAAGEGGHMSINYDGPLCRCGKPGCIESLASGPGIAARARRFMQASPQRSAALLSTCGNHSETLTSEMVAQTWYAGDALAAEVLRETIDLLALWLSNIVDLIEPDVVVIGGGAGELIAQWFPQMREDIARWSVNPRVGEIPLRAARYGADSGIVGAAAICLGTDRVSTSSEVHSGTSNLT